MIQKAALRDAKEIQALIKYYAGKGQMLFRSLGDIYENIRDFTVYKTEKGVIGVSSLHVDWEDLAEVRSLAVKETELRNGVGTQLVKASLKEAEEMGIVKIFTLTYVPEIFIKLGFYEIDKGEFPHKVWGDCVNCPKFPECDETALMYTV